LDGFISFQYGLSKYLNFNAPNILTVKVDHSQFADSRWYTGSGIYRNVYLVVKDPVHIAQWGVQFTTPKVSKELAEASTRVYIVNHTSKKTIATIECKLVDLKGALVAKTSKEIQLAGSDSVSTDLTLQVKDPQLWSVDNPNLYKLTVFLKSNGKVTDEWNDQVGIRNIRFDANEGFFLNGQNLKLKGVCIHDDAGALGVAVPEEVWLRRLKLLKEAGSNSIRMSHNPHADYLYKLCDQLGFLVIDEAFDEWEVGKNKWIKGWNVGTPGKDGYSQYFAQWSAVDLRDMILRSFNRPSIIMWSIGNEIDYPNDPYSHEILNTGQNPQIYGRGFLSDHPPASRLGVLSKQLVEVAKKYDTSRPITAALAGVVMSNTTTYPENLDVVGYNYQEYRYNEDHKTYPNRIVYGSENGMLLSAWNAVDSNQYISAQYLWTGIDYLGEAGRWPERSNRAGLLDLAGFRKPEYYFRQSLWSENPMIYIGTSPVPKTENRGIWSHRQAAPYWNWKQGDTVRVSCFTNCPEAELFLNGKSLGRKSMSAFKNRIINWDVLYQPGVLTVNGYTEKHSKAVIKSVTDTLQTSGAAYAIKAYEEKVFANGKTGLSHIVIQIVDENGMPVYDAENEVAVQIEEGAKLLGLESGRSNSHEDYKSNKRKAYHGKLLAYMQVGERANGVKVSLTSPGLKSTSIVVK
jgi:beta-galactosidase